MSDVGDAIELVFESGPGASVRLDWVDPLGEVQWTTTVEENPAGSGLYPVVLIGTSPGVWQARFYATGATAGAETFYQDYSDPAGPSPLATVNDYEEVYGALSAAREALCGALLKRASAMIRDRYRDVDTRILAGTLPANSVAMAALNMVARVMRNPSSIRSETIGPFSRSYDTSIASGLLQFTDAEAALLLPTYSGSSRVAVGTIRVRAGLAPAPYGWRRG